MRGGFARREAVAGASSGGGNVIEPARRNESDPPTCIRLDPAAKMLPILGDGTALNISIDCLAQEQTIKKGKKSEKEKYFVLRKYILLASASSGVSNLFAKIFLLLHAVLQI